MTLSGEELNTGFQKDLAEVETINRPVTPLAVSRKPQPCLLDFDLQELSTQIVELGQPAFRAKQIWDWLYKKFTFDYAEMSNMPRSLLQKLTEKYPLAPLQVLTEKVAHDGQTRKALFRLPDGAEIETVLMLYPDRATVCVSTQAGCAMGCTFCATGLMGLNRNLTAGEIVQQVLHFERFLSQTGDKKLTLGHSRVSNLVFMGMGEPLANYLNLWKAIRRLNDSQGVNLAARKMTVSTVGLPQMIRRFAGENLQVNLAVSLHAPNDSLRSEMMPINLRYPITELLQSCRDYIAATNRRLSFEYTLVQNVNDSPAAARQLGQLIKGMLCHVNLIPMNPVPGKPLQGSELARVKAFQAELDKFGIPNSVRVEKGREIQAACGQLKVEQEGKKQKNG